MGNVHSKISPSEADRWMNCPGSLILEEKCPPQERSEYAAEGTAAHEVAAKCLKQNSNAEEWRGEIVEVDGFNFKVNDEMIESVQEYLDTVRKDMEEDGIPISMLMVEQRFELFAISNSMYGTSDAAYTSPFGRLRVYDLKYGRGTYVEVEANPQLLIYALGAWHSSSRQSEEIEIVIVQPRYPGEDHVRRAVYTRKQLLKFEKDLDKAVMTVHSGSKELKSGSWCKFCPAMAICDAKTTEVFSVIPKGPTLPEAAALTVDQIVKVLSLSEVIADWAASVHAHAESLAKAGVTIPGYKLVQKKGNRRWIDEIAVETAFETMYGEEIYEKKLKSPSKLEKVVGKDEIKDYVEIPDNGTQLVPESAKGEAIQANAGNVFEALK